MDSDHDAAGGAVNEQAPAPTPAPPAAPAPALVHGYKAEIKREEVNLLPLDCYRGRITIIETDIEAAAAVIRLSHERVLGFDTETRASFTRGVHYKPSLIQLAASDTVYLFRLQHLTNLGGLGFILAAPFIIKLGVGLLFDVRQLRELHDFDPAGFVELEKLTDAIGIKNNGLRALTAIILHFRMSKKEKKSDWSRQRLTQSQISYAATDAWVAREIYLKLEAKDLIRPVPPPEYELQEKPPRPRRRGPRGAEPGAHQSAESVDPSRSGQENDDSDR